MPESMGYAVAMPQEAVRLSRMLFELKARSKILVVSALPGLALHTAPSLLVRAVLADDGDLDPASFMIPRGSAMSLYG